MLINPQLKHSIGPTPEDGVVLLFRPPSSSERDDYSRALAMAVAKAGPIYTQEEMQQIGAAKVALALKLIEGARGLEVAVGPDEVVSLVTREDVMTHIDKIPAPLVADFVKRALQLAFPEDAAAFWRHASGNS